MSDEPKRSIPKNTKPYLVRSDDNKLLVRNHKGELVPLPVPHTVEGQRVKLPRKEQDDE